MVSKDWVLYKQKLSSSSIEALGEMFENARYVEKEGKHSPFILAFPCDRTARLNESHNMKIIE